MGGESLPMVGRILLGHAQVQKTARYAHLANDPLRKASEWVASSIKQAIYRQGETQEARKSGQERDPGSPRQTSSGSRASHERTSARSSDADLS